MPYSNLDELPEAVKNLPKHAQEIWLAAFNSAYKEYGSEEKAFAVAWSAIEKAGYKKSSMVYCDVSIKSAIEDDGYKWRVRIIKAGLDANNRNWSAELLKNNLSKFEGAKVFMLSEAQHSIGHPYGKPPSDLVGWIKSVQYIDDGIYGDLIILKNTKGTELRDALVSAFSKGKTDLLGLSVDIVGRDYLQNGIREVVEIDKVTVDIVYEPAAGGNFIKMAAAKQMEVNQMTENKQIDSGQEKDIIKDLENSLNEKQKILDEKIRAAQALFDQAAKTMRLLNMETMLKESGLPSPVIEKIKLQYKDKEFTEDELKATIKLEKETLDKLTAATISGAGSIRLVTDDLDKRRQMFDDFFDGKVMSFKAAYINFTGDEQLTGKQANCKRLLAAMDTTSLPEVLKDAMNKRLQKEYTQSAYNQDWKKICVVVPRFDFRTNYITRLGGYGDLPIVAEGAAYTALTSPTDEKASYTMVKRGATETITWEMTRNDDVGVIRRIPTKVANACARQLYEFVFAFLADNPVIYTGGNLFTAAKGNLGTDALSSSALHARRRAMMNRTELGSGKRLGIPPKYLIVPTALDKTAYDLIATPRNSDFNPTNPDYTRTLQMELIVNRLWTDDNSWYLAASPSDIEGLEIGFLDGKETPEFFVQDQQTVGSVFTNDKITFKFIHLYNGAIIDDRQFDGNIVA
jgi:cation transport regulator ChaB/phage major head subunit gpT-like protein